MAPTDKQGKLRLNHFPRQHTCNPRRRLINLCISAKTEVTTRRLKAVEIKSIFILDRRAQSLRNERKETKRVGGRGEGN